MEGGGSDVGCERDGLSRFMSYETAFGYQCLGNVWYLYIWVLVQDWDIASSPSGSNPSDL